MKRYLSYFFILLSGTLWGVIGLFNRNLSAAGFSPGSIVAVRNIGGMVMLGLIFLLLLIVFSQFAVILCLLDGIVGIPADSADGNLCLFALLAYYLNKLLAALLGELGEYQADHTAVIVGIDAQVGLLYGLLDVLYHV